MVRRRRPSERRRQMPAWPPAPLSPTVTAGVRTGTAAFQEAVLKSKGPDFDIHEHLGGALPYFLNHYVDKYVNPPLLLPTYSPSTAPLSASAAPRV